MPCSEFGSCPSAAVLVPRKQGSPFFSYSHPPQFPCPWRAAPSQAAASLRGSGASLPSRAPAQPAPGLGAAGLSQSGAVSSRLWSVTERLLI